MGPVEKAVRSTVREGEILYTPTRPRPFEVGKVSSAGVVLELGSQRTPTLFSWECLEAVPPFIRERGEVLINGSGKSQMVVSGTLDGFLKGYVNRLTAGWVAVLLERAGILEIVRTTPAVVRIPRS